MACNSNLMFELDSDSVSDCVSCSSNSTCGALTSLGWGAVLIVLRLYLCHVRTLVVLLKRLSWMLPVGIGQIRYPVSDHTRSEMNWKDLASVAKDMTALTD